MVRVKKKKGEKIVVKLLRIILRSFQFVASLAALSVFTVLPVLFIVLYGLDGANMNDKQFSWIAAIKLLVVSMIILFIGLLFWKRSE